MSGVHALLVVLAVVIIVLQVKTLRDLNVNGLPKLQSDAAVPLKGYVSGTACREECVNGVCKSACQRL